MRRSTVDAAIPFVTGVLRSIICDYAWPKSYDWLRPDSVRVIVDDVYSRTQTTTQTTVSTTADGNQQLRHTDDQRQPTAITVFITGTTLREGSWSWTVAWKWSAGGCQDVGVGLTTSTANYTNVNETTTDDKPHKRGIVWHYLYSFNTEQYYTGDWTFDNDGKRRNCILLPSIVSGFAADGSVDFVADPLKRQVTFRPAVHLTDPDDADSVVLTVPTMDEFWSLRPFVAVRGAVDVVVVSND